MKEFCNKVIDFLQQEYADGYNFKVEYYQTLPTFCKAMLTVEYNKQYSLKIADSMMEWLYRLYVEGKYIEERGQYLWQKELVDMIEGG